MSWLGSKTRSRKSAPALPSQGGVKHLPSTPPPRNASEGFVVPPEFTTQLQTYSPALGSETGCSSTATQSRTRESSYNTTTASICDRVPSSSRMVRGSSVSSGCSATSSAASYGDKIVDPSTLLARQFSLDKRPAFGSTRSYNGSYSFGSLSLHQIKSTESFGSLSAVSHLDYDARSASAGSDCGVLTPTRLSQTPRATTQGGLSPAPPKRAPGASKGRSRARTLSRVPETITASPKEEIPRRSPLVNGKRFAFLAPGSKFCLTPTFGEVEWSSTTPHLREGHHAAAPSVSPKTRASPRFSLDSASAPSLDPHRATSLRPSLRSSHPHQRAKSLHNGKVQPTTDAALPPPPLPMPSRMKSMSKRKAPPAEHELGLGILCA